MNSEELRAYFASEEYASLVKASKAELDKKIAIRKNCKSTESKIRRYFRAERNLKRINQKNCKAIKQQLIVIKYHPKSNYGIQRQIEAQRVSRKNWVKQNPIKVQSQRRKRRALLAGADHSPYSWQQVVEAHGSTCWLCSKSIDLTAPRVGDSMGLNLDHLIPLSKGGADKLGNIRPTHGKCNLKKGASIIGFNLMATA